MKLGAEGGLKVQVEVQALISSVKSSWRTVISCVPQYPLLFNIFVSDLDDGAE